MPLENRFSRPALKTQLNQQYDQHMTENPKMRRRDIASALGVSEAQLIDEQIGLQSIRLNGSFKDIIKALPTLGYVMILLRNDYAVHERKGIYSNVKVGGPMGMGLIISDDRRIDLRLFLKRWKHGFAVKETLEKGDRYSLQFFDEAGSAIQKLYLQPESDFQAFDDLIKDHANEDQETPIALSDIPTTENFAEDSKVNKEKLITDWSNMTDVHQFMGLLKEHNVSREQAFNLVGKKFAERFEPAKLEETLTKLAEEQIPIMCFVGNHGGIQIHSGEINRVVKMGDWLNILDPEFNLHLLTSGITSAWVVRKPSDSGIITSLELYDAESRQIAQFFGQRTERKPENPKWKALIEATL